MILKDYVFLRKELRICGRMYLPGDRAGSERSQSENGSKSVTKYPLIIFAHGLGSNYRELEHYGPYFAKQGIACFLFDFCGGGPESLSSGSFENMSVQTEIDDLHTVLNESQKLDMIDSRNIFLMGESQGGYVAACVGAERPDDVAGLILWYPAFVIEENAKIRSRLTGPHRYDFFGLSLGERYIQDAMKIPVYQKIADYKKNVLIIHGDRDDMVPLSSSEKAMQVYENAELKVIHGGGHGFEGEERFLAAGYSARFVIG